MMGSDKFGNVMARFQDPLPGGSTVTYSSETIPGPSPKFEMTSVTNSSSAATIFASRSGALPKNTFLTGSSASTVRISRTKPSAT
jgi:hypothetical protein